MHNLSTILRKFTEITKTFAGNLVDKDGNIPRRGPKPMFSDIEVIALSMTQEYQGGASITTAGSRRQIFRQKYVRGWYLK